MLPESYKNPQMDFESVLATLKFKKIPEEEILDKVPFLVQMAEKSGVSDNTETRIRWIMGELHKIALGNIPMKRLKEHIEQTITGQLSKKGKK